jgi:hypothetical protein
MGSARITACRQFYSVLAHARAATARSAADADKISNAPGPPKLAATMHQMPDETIDDADRRLADAEREAAEHELAAATTATGGNRLRRPGWLRPRRPDWLRSTANRVRPAANRVRPAANRVRPAANRARPAAGWAAGAVLIGGLAWLLMALITDWTSYPLLNVTSWQALTYGQDSAQVSFIVHNSGNAQASHCVAYLRLGSRRLHRAVPAIPAHGTGTFFVSYRDRARNHADLGYAWAACDGAVASRQQIPTVRMADLVSGHAQILASPGSTTVRFQATEFGSSPALGCRGYLRLTTGVTLSSAGVAELRGQATAAFSVRYDPASHPGAPVAAWAQCALAAPAQGTVSSGRLYLRPLQLAGRGNGSRKQSPGPRPSPSAGPRRADPTRPT